MNILVIKIAAIGDIVMALPMIPFIREKYPKAKISWICGKSGAAILKDYNIDELIILDEQRLLAGRIISKCVELLKIWFKIAFKKFDLVIIGHKDYRYRLIAWPVIAAEKRFWGRVKGRVCPVPGRHHSDEYIRLISQKDAYNAPFGLLTPLKYSFPEHLKELINCNENSKIIAIAPGGAKNVMRTDDSRRWPISNYVELTEKILKEHDTIKVIITGAQSDEWVKGYFLKLGVVDLIGLTNISELIALYSKCSIVITHDSGPLHLAGLSGTQVIGLFGPTMPQEKAPRSLKTTIFWGGEELACRPCYDGKMYAQCLDNRCLKEISVEKVYREVLKKLEFI